MNYKKEITKISNYKRYVLPYREVGFTESESISMGIKDMKKESSGKYEITKTKNLPLFKCTMCGDTFESQDKLSEHLHYYCTGGWTK